MENPGLSRNVQQGLQGQPIPQLAQTSPGAPMANPAPQMPNPSEMTGVGIPNAPKQPGGETELIVKALIDRLKFNTKASEQSQQVPAQVPMPSGVGGGNGLQGYVNAKIPKLMHEGYPNKQAVAIAYSMGRDRNKGGGEAKMYQQGNLY